jgi:hypothetical protein
VVNSHQVMTYKPHTMERLAYCYQTSLFHSVSLSEPFRLACSKDSAINIPQRTWYKQKQLHMPHFVTFASNLKPYSVTTESISFSIFPFYYWFFISSRRLLSSVSSEHIFLLRRVKRICIKVLNENNKDTTLSEQFQNLSKNFR